MGKSSTQKKKIDERAAPHAVAVITNGGGHAVSTLRDCEGVLVNIHPEAFFPIRSEGQFVESSPWLRDTPPSDSADGRVPLLISPGIKEDVVLSVAQFMCDFHLCDFDQQTVSTDVKVASWCPETAFSEPKPVRCPAPESIYAFFTDDLNILKIHEAICARFGYLFYKAPSMKSEAIEMQKQAADFSSCLTVVERAEKLERGKELYERAVSLETRRLWNEYCDSARVWLELYAPLASDEAQGSIKIGGGEERFGSDRDYDIRLRAIEAYLEIAKKYININAFHNTDEVSRCPVCGISSTEIAVVSGEEHGMTICECGREVVGITRSATFRDSTRIDSGVKNSYEDLGNFIKRIDAFEGKQKTPLPAPLFRQLEEYFESNPLPNGLTCAQIRASPLVKGKKVDTSIALLGEALHATNNTAYYRDVELIANKLWGWELADLTTRGLRCQLIADYISTQKVYEEYKERGSSLHVNLRLYYHLKARGYDCELSDFKIVSSLDSLKYHDRMLKIMSEKCGLPIINLLPLVVTKTTESESGSNTRQNSQSLSS